MNVKILIEKGEDGYFVASVPSLKGCWSQGKTREEASENIREAIEFYLESDVIETVDKKAKLSNWRYEITFAFRSAGC